mgnify:CR=1 FL=1
MDWLVILLILISTVVGLLQNAKKEAVRPSRPRPLRPMPLPSPPRRAELEPEMAEGVSLEEQVEVFGEGAAGEEGVSLEGDFAEAEPVLVPEVLCARGELERERMEFYLEAGELARVEEGEGEALSEADLFPFGTEEETETPSSARARLSGWFLTREDLVRAVVALELLGPPGGRWRFLPSGGGEKIHGA